jgi:hypothetical protein
MTPKQVERLEKTLGRVAREQGLDQERLRRWVSFLALCGVLESAVEKGVIDIYYLKGRLATDTLLLASSLYFLQGTFEKIQFHSLFGQHPIELVNLFAERDFTRVLRPRYIADVCRGQLLSPPA